MLIYAKCEKLDQSELDAYPNISSKMAEMVRKDEDAGDAAIKQEGSSDKVEQSVKETSTGTNEKKAKTSKLCNVI